MHQIALLIGRGADAYALDKPQLAAAALALPEILPADLLARRADIAAAQARIETAAKGREVARKAFYPDINLLGLVGVAAISGVGPLLAGNAVQYGVGAALHLPIFDAGKLRANLAGATADVDAAIADYNQVGRDLGPGSGRRHHLAAGGAGPAGRAVDRHERRPGELRLARERYTSGLIPQLNVLERRRPA